MEKKERQIGLDIIRMLAIVFVFITHGIQYKGLLDQDVTTMKWRVTLLIRFIALSCVPLFIILTGFLNNKKEINKKYYKGIIPLLLSYFLISFIELFGTHILVIKDGVISLVWQNVKNINWPVSLTEIFNFTLNSYGWYFEMYLGLFLLIPFFNILWDNLKDRKEKIALVVSCCLLTLVPKLLEGIRVPALNVAPLAGWLDVLPDWWKAIHPLAYFFIGKLIRDLRPNYNIIVKLMMLTVSVAIPFLLCYFASQRDGSYAWYVCNGFGTLTNAFIAVSIFLMFYTVKFKVPVISQVITQISICSFEMYLFSSIFDKLYYNYFDKYNMITIVPMVLVSTFICARIWILIRDFVLKRVLKAN